MLNLFKRRATVMAGCGHETKLCDKITVIENGAPRQIEITIKTKKPPFCHKCFEKMVIRCAWCGDYIIPGDPITLYIPEESFQTPEHAVVYKENPRQLVGCLRFNCADTGADRAGFWVTPGKVQPVLSPLQEAMMNPDTVIITSDLSDIKQAKLIED